MLLHITTIQCTPKVGAVHQEENRQTNVAYPWCDIIRPLKGAGPWETVGQERCCYAGVVPEFNP